MINATAEYALRVVVFLAVNGDELLSRERIARGTKIPNDYLVKVLMALDAAKITVSRRGPGGGYKMTRNPEELTAYEVIAAVSALPRIEKCPLGIESHIDLCPLHARLDEIAALQVTAYQATTIIELIPRKLGKNSRCSFPANENKKGGRR